MLDFAAAKAIANYNTDYANSCLNSIMGIPGTIALHRFMKEQDRRMDIASKKRKCWTRDCRKSWHDYEAGLFWPPVLSHPPPALKRCFSEHKFLLHFTDLLLYLWFDFLHLFFVFFVLNWTIKFTRQFIRLNYMNILNDFLNCKNKGFFGTPFSPCCSSLYKCKIWKCSL